MTVPSKMTLYLNLANSWDSPFFYNWHNRDWYQSICRYTACLLRTWTPISLRKNVVFVKNFAQIESTNLRYYYTLNWWLVQSPAVGIIAWTRRDVLSNLPTFQHTRQVKTSVFLEFDDLGFPSLRHAFLAIYASRLTKYFQPNWHWIGTEMTDPTPWYRFLFSTMRKRGFDARDHRLLKFSFVETVFHRLWKPSFVQFVRQPSVSTVCKDA